MRVYDKIVEALNIGRQATRPKRPRRLSSNDAQQAFKNTPTEVIDAMIGEELSRQDCRKRTDDPL